MKKKVPNFKAPEGYFEGFMDRLKDRMDEKSSIIPEDDGFGVPEGYFESFGDHLQEKLPQQGRLIQFKPWMYAAAAGIALLLLIPFTNNEPEQNFELAKSELEEYWEEADLEFAAFEISESSEWNPETLIVENPDLETDELQHYLEQELDLEDQEHLMEEDLILDYDEAL